jgi:ELWxxDGT repeat protein
MLAYIDRLEPRRMLALSLLADFNSNTAPSYAQHPVMLGSVGYMFATDPQHGTELWRTDGTPAGTSLLKDILPGPAGSGGFGMQRSGGLLYFPASSGGVNLWRSDGTAAGTFKLTNVGTSQGQFLIGEIADHNGTAIFGTNRFGLWRSDGTVVGTMQIAPVYAGNLARLGNDLYFIGNALSGGESALWKTDGTPGGTSIVRQFSGATYSNVTALNGRLYFSAADATLNTGQEPWSSDGTFEGTVPLGDLVPGTGSSSPYHFVALNDEVFFTSKASASSTVFDWHLFRTDGTPNSATAIANIGNVGSYASDHPRPIAYGDKLYFQGNSKSSGKELWRSDGTAEGTGMFIDLDPGIGSSYPSSFQIYNGRLSFKARTDDEGFELHSTDGTIAGTTLVREIAPGSNGIDYGYLPGVAPTILNGRMYFQANDLAHGAELWSTDGTAEGTALLKDINTVTTDFDPGPMTPGPGGLHYFAANDGFNGPRLWRTDGTAAGTSMLRDSQGNPLSLTGTPVYANGLLLFVSGGLWRSDGTDAGTFRVSGAPQLSSSTLVQVNNRVYFAASDYSLWVSDGTEAGTRLVKPADSSFSTRLFSGMELNGQLICLVWNQGASDTASLWISDGTAAGTTPLRHGMPDHTTIVASAVFNGRTYFTMSASQVFSELWISDGTAAGTVVSEIYSGSRGSYPNYFVATQDALYFSAEDATNGRELWRIEKSSADTPERVTTLTSSAQQVRASAKGGVLFTAGNELYRYDGSSIIPLKTAGFTGSPTLLGSGGRRDYFAAATSAAGSELWTTDGTADGTLMVQDLASGSASSSPQNLGFINGRVFVAATVPSVGRELFELTPFAPLNSANDPHRPTLPLALSQDQQKITILNRIAWDVL